MRKANRLIPQHTETDPRLVFVDIDTPMIGPDGRPKAEWFRKDGLHLNAAGYQLWTEVLMPHLEPYLE